LEKEGKDILQKSIQLVEGGEHRQQSVATLSGSESSSGRHHLVHDAVRPFGTTEIIQEVVTGVKKHGAPSLTACVGHHQAIDAQQMLRSLKQLFLVKKFVMAQTPQGFRYGCNQKAFDQATADALSGLTKHRWLSIQNTKSQW